MQSRLSRQSARLLFSAAFLLILLGAPALCPRAQDVVINEVMFFPDTANTVPERNHEWVELYNSGSPASVGGWVISNRDGSSDAILPSWSFPSSTYLVIHFTTGTNDNDFSDGQGHYYTGTADVFSEAEDECALYTDLPSDTTIIDFMNWSETNDYTPGTAHDYAVSAGIWTNGDFFTPVDAGDIYAEIAWVTPGESMGRDSSSTDSNLSDDWETFGGADAIYATPGEVNYQLLQVVPSKGGSTKGNPAAWTVIFYLNGESNLDAHYFRLLDDMERLGSLPNVNLVVMADFKTAVGGHTLRGLLQAHNDSGTVHLDTLAEKNMGDPQTLGEFIHWAQQNYWGAKFVLFIKDHGGGWKGISWDDTDGDDGLYMQELYAALDYTIPPQLDVVVFDACLMGMVEVARQVKQRVDMMVASEETKTVFDFPYNDIFLRMDANPGWSAEQLAVDIVAKAKANVTRDDYTFSAIDCQSLQPLISQIDEFGFELEWGLDDYDFHYNNHDDPNDNVQIHVRNQLVQTEHFYDANFIDLYHFSQLIKADAAIPDDYKSQAQPIMNSLQKGGSIIKAEEHGGAHPNAHGLSIYFPTAQTKGPSWNPPDPPVLKQNAGCRENVGGVWVNYSNCESPYDDPWPSHLPDNSDLAKYAFDPDDCNPPHDPCVNHFSEAKDHPYEATPGFFFVQDTWWDEFLHRYYEPVADAGEDQQAFVGGSVTLSGSGSSDADGNVTHWYWDFNASVDAPPDCPPGEEDWDRDCLDEANDDRDGGDAVQVDFPCTGEGTFSVMLTVWDDHNLQPGHGEHFETDQDPVVVKCIDTTFTVRTPSDETQHENGNFETAEFSASDGTGNNVVSVDAVFTGTGVDSIQVIYVFPPPAPYVGGYVKYKVVDHCQEGGVVSMTATNDAEEMVTGDFAIGLMNTDPVIACPPDQSFDYGDGYSSYATATDEDGDPLSFLKIDGPGALQVVEDGTIIWETGPGDVGGPYDVIVGVTDTCGATAACSFALTVTAPIGCCQHSDYCEMTTEMVCMDMAGTVWYPAPYECVEEMSCQAPCGDCNLDGIVNLSDAITGLNYLFKGAPPPEYVCLLDVTCDHLADIGDVVYLLNYLFKAGPLPCPDCCAGAGKAQASPGQGTPVNPVREKLR
jgi:hypothetical protein